MDEIALERSGNILPTRPSNNIVPTRPNNRRPIREACGYMLGYEVCTVRRSCDESLALV